MAIEIITCNLNFRSLQILRVLNDKWTEDSVGKKKKKNNKCWHGEIGSNEMEKK